MTKTPVTIVKDATGKFVSLSVNGETVPVTLAAIADIGSSVGLNVFADEAEIVARIGGVEMPVYQVGRAPMNGKMVLVVGVPNVDPTIETQA